MVADEAGRGPAAGATRVRLRWLAAVVAVMALLTGGWPLLNAAVANKQPLRAGAKVTIGSGRTNSATVTVGHGWYVQPAQSDPALLYVLRNGPVVIDVRHVSFTDRQQFSLIWHGMRQMLAVTVPGSALSKPARFTTASGRLGITGSISGAPLMGTVTVVPGPSRQFAIALVVLAPRHTSQARQAAAEMVVRSLRFDAPGR